MRKIKLVPNVNLSVPDFTSSDKLFQFRYIMEDLFDYVENSMHFELFETPTFGIIYLSFKLRKLIFLTKNNITKARKLKNKVVFG